MSSQKMKFLKALHQEWSPILGSKGFTGDDWQFRRFRDPFIDCIWIQSRSDQKACCVNLGEHLNFFPISSKSTLTNLNQIEQIDCVIKRRLAPEGEVDYWWDYSNLQQGVESLIEMFSQFGEPFFSKFENFPEPFSKITPEDIENGKLLELLSTTTKVKQAALLARVNEHIGNIQRAKEFAEFGLKNAGMAVASKKMFKEILKK